MEILPDISIAITCQAGVDLAPCLQALSACLDPVSVQIFVPENAVGWQDWQEELPISSLALDPANYLAQAWSHGTGRYLAVWDGAVLPAPAALFSLLEFLDEHPDVGAVGPRFFSEQGTILPSIFRSTNPLAWQDGPPLGWDGLASQEVAWLNGAVLLVNREAVRDIGLPQGKLAYWSRDYCRRLHKQGWHIYFCHLARVTTHRPLPPAPSLFSRCCAKVCF